MATLTTGGSTSPPGTPCDKTDNGKGILSLTWVVITHAASWSRVLSEERIVARRNSRTVAKTFYEYIKCWVSCAEHVENCVRNRVKFRQSLNFTDVKVYARAQRGCRKYYRTLRWISNDSLFHFVVCQVIFMKQWIMFGVLRTTRIVIFETWRRELTNRSERQMSIILTRL